MRWTLPATLLALTVLVTGCEAFDQLGKDKIVIGVVLGSPVIERPDGTVVSEGLVVADVFFGEKESAVDVLTTPPTAILGADVSLIVYKDVENLLETVPLPGLGDGHYATNSADAPELVYSVGAEYRVEVTEDPAVAAYVVVVDRAPAAEAPIVPDTHPAGVDLTVQRTGTDTAFVSVLRIADSGVEETWNNRPEDPLGLLSVVIDPSPWQVTAFEVPGGEAFPSAGLYAVVLTTVERGVPDTSLFTASGVYVGAGAARVVQVQ